MKDDGEFSCDGDARLLEANLLGEPQPHAFSVEKPMFLVSKVVAAS